MKGILQPRSNTSKKVSKLGALRIEDVLNDCEQGDRYKTLHTCHPLRLNCVALGGIYHL